MTFTLPSIPAYVTNIKLVIQASEPQGNGITRAYSKAAAFASPYTPVTTAIDIKSAYDSKNGARSQGIPQVFLREHRHRREVRRKDGQRSAECLASAVGLEPAYIISEPRQSESAGARLLVPGKDS